MIRQHCCKAQSSRAGQDRSEDEAENGFPRKQIVGRGTEKWEKGRHPGLSLLRVEEQMEVTCY